MEKKRISQTNLQVKQEMHQALMRLIKEKTLSTISVSDLTAEAGVSRMTFYRNYHAIEDVLMEHLDEVVEEYKREETEIESTVSEEEKIFYGKKYMLHCFLFFYAHREFLDVLITGGMGDLFLAKITEYMIGKWIDEKSGTRETVLKISAYAGSVYNMYREWSKGNFRESAEEVAGILYDLAK